MSPRPKTTFGLPQRDYIRKHKIVDQIIHQLLLHDAENHRRKPDLITKLNKKNNVPPSALYRWLQKIRRDPLWRPYNGSINHGMRHRIFTDDEEQSIADFIRINIISNHYHFTDRNFILERQM